MSRCFPYPPPGYTPSRASKEALIESIKLQKEQEKAKARKKKEKRRENEDKRKKRKDEKNEMRKKTSEKTDLNSKKRKKREEGMEEKGRKKEGIKKPDLNSNKFNFPNGQIGKNTWVHGEQLERSGLTEEHDQTIRLHLPCKSSESTENSSERKRASSPVNVIRGGHGTIVRIQLSSKKQNLSDISINEQQLCSTSGRTDVPPLRNWQPNFYASTEKTSYFVQGDSNRTDKKQMILTSGKSELAPAKTRTPPDPDTIEGSKKISESVRYKNIIENWVPPPSLQDTPFSLEDLDWLVCSKDHDLRPERRQKFENDSVFCSSSSSLRQPRAQLLPELDVYALPFTVPY